MTVGSCILIKSFMPYIDMIITMNLPVDHPITDAELAQFNNPLGKARDPSHALRMATAYRDKPQDSS